MNRGTLGLPRGRGRLQQPLAFPLSRPSPTEYAQGATTNITITGNASTNTESAYTQLSAEAPFTADGFWLSVVAFPVADFLIDIAVGTAGSEIVILENLLINGGSTALIHTCPIYVPLKIDAGVRVAGRFQSTDGSVSLDCNISFVRGGMYEAMRCVRAVTYGANPADSGGVSIDPGGSANTKGAWTELSAATEYPIDYALIGIGGQNNATRAGAHHFFDIGHGGVGAEVVAVEGCHTRQDNSSDNLMPFCHMRWCRIPGGQRLIARQQCSVTDATDRLADVAVVGFTA